MMKTESDETKKLEDSQLEIVTTREDMFNEINLKVDKDNVVKRDFHSQNKNYYKKIGNTLALIFDKNGSPLIVIGPHCK